MTQEFLLRYHRQGFNPRALEMVNLTLEKMAYGGIYDQVGGGFHRYSTDPYWLVPHFEKMLYDNAQLARLYLHAYQVTGSGLFRRITEETLDYVLREMTGPEGGFYSAQDADSEGEEGKFFVWTPAEISAILGEREGEIFSAFYGVTEGGNFEGKNILNITRDDDAFADSRSLDLAEFQAVIRRNKSALLQVRDQRVHPLLDDKVLTSWNGLMLRAFAEAAAALGREDYLAAAINNARFLTTVMNPQGRLLRTYRNGEAKLLAYLEDYSFAGDGLLALYEATFDPQWLTEAASLADSMIELFWDEAVGGFYDTGSDHEELVIRPRDVFDHAQPCGGSVATDFLLRLAIFTNSNEYATKAVTPLRSLRENMARAPASSGVWLGALDFYVSTPKEVAIVGPQDDPATHSLLDAVFGQFMPNKVVAGSWDTPTPETGRQVPLLQDRGMLNGRPTAYVCQNYACQLPVNDPDALLEQLSS